MSALVSVITSWLCHESGVVHSFRSLHSSEFSLVPFVQLIGTTAYGSRSVEVIVVVTQSPDGSWGTAIGARHCLVDGGPWSKAKAVGGSGFATWEQALVDAFEQLDERVARFADLASLVSAVQHEIDFVVVSNPDITTYVD